MSEHVDLTCLDLNHTVTVRYNGTLNAIRFVDGPLSTVKHNHNPVWFPVPENRIAETVSDVYDANGYEVQYLETTSVMQQIRDGLTHLQIRMKLVSL